MKHDSNPSYINAYFDSWKSSDLGIDFGHDFSSHNAYLQHFKALFGVPDLKSRTKAVGGIQTIDAMDWQTATQNNLATAPYAAFIAERDAGLFSDCKDRDSWQSFAIRVNGSEETFTLTDPAGSQWHLDRTGPESELLAIGSGGSVEWLTVTPDAITVASAIATFGLGMAALSMETAIAANAGRILAISTPNFAEFGAMRLAYIGAIKVAYTLGAGSTLAGMLDLLVSLTKDESNPLKIEDKQALKRQANVYALKYTMVYDNLRWYEPGP